MAEHTNINIASFLESTNLSPTARREDIIVLCENALKYNFLAVCIHPYYLPLASSLLQGSTVKLVTVIGFPLGVNDGRTKSYEAELAVDSGVAEVDMVLNIAALKNKDTRTIVREVTEVVKCGAITKVIIETGYFDKEELSIACFCIQEGGAHFVKTCTGLGPRGVTLGDVLLLRNLIPPTMGIKAAGGINTAAFAQSLIDAGASRLGTSKAETIMQQFKEGIV